MKNYWGMRILGGIVFVAAAILLFGFVTMKLWNGLVPDLFHGPVITFCQALGILVLGKLLFGGFGGRGWGRGCGCGCSGGGRWGGRWGGRSHWRERWEQKMANMTPEEKEKYKQAWRNRCGGWYEEETAKSSETGEKM